MKKNIIFFVLLISTIIVFGQSKTQYFLIYEYCNERSSIVLDDISKDSIREISPAIKKTQKKLLKYYYLYKNSPKIISHNPIIQKAFDKNMETLLSIISDYFIYIVIPIDNEDLEEELCYCINIFIHLLKKGASISEIDNPLFEKK